MTLITFLAIFFLTGIPTSPPVHSFHSFRICVVLFFANASAGVKFACMHQLGRFDAEKPASGVGNGWGVEVIIELLLSSLITNRIKAIFNLLGCSRIPTVCFAYRPAEGTRRGQVLRMFLSPQPAFIMNPME